MNKLILVLTIVILFILFALGMRILNFATDPLMTGIASASFFLTNMLVNGPEWLYMTTLIIVSIVGLLVIFTTVVAQVLCSAAFAMMTLNKVVIPFYDECFKDRQKTKIDG